MNLDFTCCFVIYSILVCRQHLNVVNVLQADNTVNVKKSNKNTKLKSNTADKVIELISRVKLMHENTVRIFTYWYIL